MTLRRTPTLVTPPATEPVSLSELKLFARIDSDDEDALLSSLIESARIAAENYTRRAFITQTWRLSVDLPCQGWANALSDGVYDLPVTALYSDMPDAIRLLRPPVVGITGVTTYDLLNAPSVLSPSAYTLDAAGARLVLNQGASWPSGMRQYAAVEIVTANGYGASASNVPQPIRQAIMMHATKIYERECGYEIPPGVEQLLRQYRVMDHL